ncbi:zinc ribbon domain-containing protein [Methanobrevibacter sp.]|uniref:zinc ribbon domain-containing protein n=1 Tax=Methanobrevibacter sp. TaxID=66852 RepID=UPI0025EBC229|nr:zinc ribbon domain-containing protein [Methanobrevibacter sp.]MBR4447146.1 zinc-ribbon domain-containing protein [Methanobrevibacter sp.]
MRIIKHCPNCGCEINDDDVEFCTECGYNLFEKNEDVPKGFFDNLADKTNFSVLIFSFIVFGVFLFVGSIIWASFMASGSIDLITYLLLTVVFSVFFGGIFIGYFGCRDETYVLPNFSMYLGSIFAVVLCGIGFIFTFLMGIISAISSAFSALGGNSAYGSTQSTASSFTPSVDLSFVFKIILFVLLIPVAAYFGVYLGYYLKQNI